MMRDLQEHHHAGKSRPRFAPPGGQADWLIGNVPKVRRGLYQPRIFSVNMLFSPRMATIKDVARVAGVGLGTASRVVSGKGSVAPETAKRVQRAIKKLKFRPSHAARSLLSGSTQLIGVYIPILK